MRLNGSDIDLLMEALDAKLHADLKDDLLHMTIVTMLSRSKEDADAELARCKNDMDSKKKTHRVLEDRCTLVKAKLIQLRDECDAESLFSNSNKGINECD